MNIFCKDRGRKNDYALTFYITDDPEVSALLEEIQELAAALEEKVGKLKYKDVQFDINICPTQTEHPET